MLNVLKQSMYLSNVEQNSRSQDQENTNQQNPCRFKTKVQDIFWCFLVQFH